MKKIIMVLLAGLMVIVSSQAQTQPTKKANTGSNQGIIKDSTNLGTNYGNTTDAPAGAGKATTKTKKQMRQEKRAAKKNK